MFKMLNVSTKDRKAYNAAYNAAHKDEIAAQKKIYRLSHLSAAAAASSRYRARHKAQEAERAATYYLSHKEQQDAYRASYRDAHRDEMAAYQEAYKIVHHDRKIALKRETLEAYGGAKCACCGEMLFEGLTIDHINGGGAAHRKAIGHHNLYSWLKSNGFPAGFQVLCGTCNLAKGRGDHCPHRDVLGAENVLHA